MIRFLLLLLANNPVWTWVHRLGGPGLILLGLADNSVVPLPGSMDVFVIILASHRRELWFYYALMATCGAIAGGYLTYRLAAKGGEETLEKKFGKQRVQKVYKRFEKRGYITVFIGAILPPPFPIVPFLMAAGVLQYPARKFLGALGSGRAVRFFAVAYIGHRWGQSIINFFSQYYQPVLYALITLGVLGGIAALVYFKWYRPKRRAEQLRSGEKVDELPNPLDELKSGEEKRAGHPTA